MPSRRVILLAFGSVFFDKEDYVKNTEVFSGKAERTSEVMKSKQVFFGGVPMERKFFCVVFALCIGVVVWFGQPTAEATVVVNGDFSNGLNDWTVESGNVSDGGGFALFEEHPTQILSTLVQQFALPDWSSMSLLFDVKMSATQGGAYDPFAWPDAFTASLLDPVTLDPLIANPGRTDFFYIDNTNSIITIGTLMLRLDLSGLGGLDAALYFDLIGSDDGMLTSVSLDNVEIIPEPCSLLLWLVGMGSLAFLRKAKLVKP